MRVIHRLALSTLILAVVAACADAPPAPTAPDAPEARWSETTDEELEVVRPEIDVTTWDDSTTLISADLLLLGAADGIGTGSAIVITIPNEGRFGCTANFVWEHGGQLYLGAAGHCFLPGDRRGTHGAGADYDASGVKVIVCVDDCEGNFRSNLLVGTWVDLGKVAYARQTDATGDEQVGWDFGVVEIPAEAEHLVRLTMPVWGGPTGTDFEFETGELGCHYGNGLIVGETVLTKARTGISGGADPNDGFWQGDFAGAFGDSGSGLNSCTDDGTSIIGQGAVGVLTHLGVAACPCDVKFKNMKIKAEHGIIFGTTVARAQEMAREANLDLSLVLQ